MANVLGTQVGRYLVGRNVYLMTAAALYIDGSGNLVPEASNGQRDLHTAGVFDTFEVSLDYGLTEISPTDGTITNYVQTKVDFEFTLGEIQGPGGYSKTAFAGLAQSNYYGVECITADGATGEYFQTTIVGAYQNMRYGVVEGKNVVMAVFKPCGIFPYFAMVQGAGSAAAIPGGSLSGNTILKGRALTSTHP